MIVGQTSAAFAVQTPQSNVVSAVPAAYTPNVNDGVVYAIGQSGSTVFLGGSFTSVTPHGSSTAVSANEITAFTAGTGALVTSFAPTVVGGQVATIIPGPTPGTVYVGGSFKTVDGVAAKVVLLDAATGAIVPGWKPAAPNGAVNRLVLSNGQLFVGGYFSLIGKVARGGLATLNPTTGALTAYSQLSFTGHHNYGVACNPSHSTCADGAVGLKAFDINPAGTQLVAIGNFTNVSGLARDQIALIDLGPTSDAVDPNWSTLAFSAACSSGSFDSYIRDVQYSTDGTYFVVVATGASGTNTDGTNSSCDTASRYEATGTGTNVRPTWIDYTGRDSLWAVAITGTAVYVGGHQRWLNNSKGSDKASFGAVPRPGVAALDPTNGMPLAWNPGRNPRGAGAYAVLATADGLYVGSDTDYIGNRIYQRDRIAFFPLAGGETLATNQTGTLPGNVYLVGGPVGPSGVRQSTWSGTSAPGTLQALSGAPDLTTARGAFDVNNTVYYGATDGNFYERSFDGKQFGPAVAIDPYDDPVWSNISTGSGQTYRGVKSGIYTELPSVTSMFYSGGRVYYTLSGHSQMFWRWFEPDDGVVGSDEFTVNDGQNWSRVSGAFLVGGTLYFSDSLTHALSSVPFVNGQAAGTPTVVDSTQNWTSDGAFVVSAGNIANQPPVAAFTSNCGATPDACTFDASGSGDPDGSIVSYAWSFGDGSTDSEAGSQDQHTYAADGAYSVTLTVTDNQGASTSVTHSVDLGVAPPAPIAFVGSSTKYVNNTSESVPVPAGVAAGDGMLLFDTFTSATATTTAPSGWTEIGQTVKGTQTTIAYERVADATDPGSSVSVTYSAQAKASLTLAAYSGTSPTTLVESFGNATAAGASTDTAPGLSGLADGSYVVSFWADRSSATTSFTPPASTTQRSLVLGTGSATVNALLADSAGAVSGSYGPASATTNDASADSSSWSIALNQAML
jgi:PKD repeat protein